MNKDYQLYHLSHYENREDIIKTLLERITTLESEVNQLRQENMTLKNKYVSSLRNVINEKSNPFSVSLHMNEPNCVDVNQKKKKKRKATSFYNYNCNNKDISFKKGNKLNHSQANISMYLPTDNNENNNIEGDECNNNNNKVYVSTIKKKKKPLSLSQSTLRVSPEKNEAKIDTSYLVTESECNNNNNSSHKDNGIKNDLKQKQLRFNSKNHNNASPYNTNTNSDTNAINGNTIANSNANNKVPHSNKDNRSLLIDYYKTRNAKNTISITKANANSNTNTNNNTRFITNTTANANTNAIINEKYQSNSSTYNNINSYNTNTNSKHNCCLLSEVYNKKVVVSSDKKETGRELKEKKNQLIQIHRKLFSKSPLLKKYL